MQVLRYSIALALVGCVQFDRTPERTPDARPQTDGSTSPDGPESLSEAAERVITTWQSCLTVGDIEESGLSVTWPALLTDMAKTCNDCHSAGANGFLVSADKTILTTTLQSNRTYLLGYFTVDLTRGAADAAMVINTAVQEAVSQAQPPYQNHPRYNPADGLLASEKLRGPVQSRIDSGPCGP